MQRMISKNFDVPGMHRLKVARQHGAYLGLAKARRMKRAEVIREVDASGLRGRDGAGFPVAKKFALVPAEARSIIVMNADESDPGTFKDRAIFMRDPHLVLEGLLIAACAIGAREGYAYFRAEYEDARALFSQAVAEAREAGLVGTEGAVDDVVCLRGADAYGCGEESASIACIEGGASARPFVVNNAETLAALPFILREGAAPYRAMGTEKSPGTKLVSVSGCVRRPGVYEVEMGTPLSVFLRDEAGGIEEGRELKAVIPGGVSTAVLTASEALACAIDFESLADAGSALGGGGMIAIDEGFSMVSALADIARFYAGRSCGRCTTCREGTGWIAKILARIERGEGRASDVNLLCDLAEAMGENAMCALAGSVSVSVLSFVAKFRREFESAVRGDGVFSVSRKTKGPGFPRSQLPTGISQSDR